MKRLALYFCVWHHIDSAETRNMYYIYICCMGCGCMSSAYAYWFVIVCGFAKRLSPSASFPRAHWLFRCCCPAAIQRLTNSAIKKECTLPPTCIPQFMLCNLDSNKHDNRHIYVHPQSTAPRLIPRPIPPPPYITRTRTTKTCTYYFNCVDALCHCLSHTSRIHRTYIETRIHQSPTSV